MESSQTRARTCVPCIGRRILNHCATRLVPRLGFIGHETRALPCPGPLGALEPPSNPQPHSLAHAPSEIVWISHLDFKTIDAQFPSPLPRAASREARHPTGDPGGEGASGDPLVHSHPGPDGPHVRVSARGSPEAISIHKMISLLLKYIIHRHLRGTYRKPGPVRGAKDTQQMNGQPLQNKGHWFPQKTPVATATYFPKEQPLLWPGRHCDRHPGANRHAELRPWLSPRHHVGGRDHGGPRPLLPEPQRLWWKPG